LTAEHVARLSVLQAPVGEPLRGDVQDQPVGIHEG